MSHGRLMKTMFWTGALLALMPVALGLIVVGVVLHQRRERRRRGGSDGGT
ncbi:MAG TPA: hypothetical protein VEH83_01495 [Gemmatimonadales bacterium]|nr:hypothetical protein [Gemmatimonadales bacterium]